jgi:hypothetical protein
MCLWFSSLRKSRKPVGYFGKRMRRHEIKGTNDTKPAGSSMEA